MLSVGNRTKNEGAVYTRKYRGHTLNNIDDIVKYIIHPLRKKSLSEENTTDFETGCTLLFVTSLQVCFCSLKPGYSVIEVDSFHLTISGTRIRLIFYHMQTNTLFVLGRIRKRSRSVLQAGIGSFLVKYLVLNFIDGSDQI